MLKNPKISIRFLLLFITINALMMKSVASDSEIVKVGAQQLISEYINILHNQRIGLITNQSAVIGGEHIVDILLKYEDFNLTALFAPEHGIRGDADAGAEILDTVDTRTGIPIFSLHGQTLRPTKDMLADIDVLIFDIQDVGTRFYTYISTMGLAMQAAAEMQIPFIVLDRPNPIGGERIEGFRLETKHKSFIGMFEIPVTHGMTVGELALMIKGEGLIDGLKRLDLSVIPMKGWKRSMLWDKTGLPWVPPSPNIPTFETAVIYPGTCYFGSTSVNEGRGTYEPFIVIGAPWANGNVLADKLNQFDLPGIRFEPVVYIPKSIKGMSTNPKLLGIEVFGVRSIIEDPYLIIPLNTGVHMLHTFYHHALENELKNFFNVTAFLRVAGTERFHLMIMNGYSPNDIIESWKDDVEEFSNKRKKYLLYE